MFPGLISRNCPPEETAAGFVNRLAAMSLVWFRLFLTLAEESCHEVCSI